MNQVKVLREGERMDSGKAEDGPSHDGKSAKASGRVARIKGSTAQLQLGKESRY